MSGVEITDQMRAAVYRELAAGLERDHAISVGWLMDEAGRIDPPPPSWDDVPDGSIVEIGDGYLYWYRDGRLYLHATASTAGFPANGRNLVRIVERGDES